MVGEHHAAGAEPDPLGTSADRGQQDGRGAAGDAGHRMVLGHPEPLIAQLLDLDRALDGMLEGNGLGMTMTGARTIEQGEPHAVINAAGHEELPGFGVENLSLPR